MSLIPAALSADRRYFAVVIAKVDKNVDPEGEGRIKVTFPWFNDEMVSEWCRVAQLYAGSGYGAMFVPEEGDEVLVAFVHGDMRLPIIIGGLYNGVDKPPSALARAESTDTKFIQTKAGHKIVLHDTDEGKKIEVIDSKGHNSIVIDTEADTITIRCEQDLTVESASGKLTLKGNGVEIRSDADIDINATDGLNLNGTDVAMTASAGLNLDGTDVAMAASAGLNLDGTDVAVAASAGLDQDGANVSVNASTELKLTGQPIKLN